MYLGAFAWKSPRGSRGEGTPLEVDVNNGISGLFGPLPFCIAMEYILALKHGKLYFFVVVLLCTSYIIFNLPDNSHVLFPLEDISTPIHNDPSLCPVPELGQFHHDQTLFSRSLEITGFYREIIPKELNSG